METNGAQLNQSFESLQTKIRLPSPLTAQEFQALKKQFLSQHPGKEISRDPSSNDSIIVPSGCEINIAPFCFDTWELVDIFLALNPEPRIEFVSTSSFIIKIMSKISDNIAQRAMVQITNANMAAGDVGAEGGASAEFRDNWHAPHFLKADGHWTINVNHFASNPTANNRVRAVPDFVLEVRSPTDQLVDQQQKMRRWITGGVNFGILIDCVDQVPTTYCYATTASGLLPAPGANANTTAIGGVTQQSFPWPPLPPIAANGIQYGPPLLVPIPAGSIIGAALPGLLNINHGIIRLN